MQFARKAKPEQSEEEIEAAKKAYLDRIKKKFAEEDYIIVGGVDEGSRLMVASEAHCLEGGEFIGKLTKYKSRSFHYDSGQLYFKEKCRKIYARKLDNIERKRGVVLLHKPDNDNDRGFQLTQTLKDDELMERRKLRREQVRQRILAKKQRTKKERRYLELPDKFNKMDKRNRMELSNRSFNYVDYVRFELDIIPEAQETLTHRDLAHYKFKRAIFITKTAINIARQLAETGKILPNQRVEYRLHNKFKPNDKVRQENNSNFLG